LADSPAWADVVSMWMTPSTMVEETGAEVITIGPKGIEWSP
jgi:hypothetical protein